MTAYTYEVARRFEKHGFSSIVTLAVTDTGEIALKESGDKYNILSDNSAVYMLNYAMRTFQDAYAGSDSRASVTESFEERYARIIDGTIGTRSRIDDRTRAERECILLALSLPKNAEKLAAYKPLKGAAANAYLDNMADWQSDNPAFARMVEAKIAEYVRAREAAATLAESVDLDL